ncbi:MAG: NAD-dependent epimerase/dehydratase family protein, partial [Myxococcota bacterium]
MKALITGGTGFLGGAIAQALRERGDTVRSLARRRSAKLAALGVEQIVGDICYPTPVKRAMKGCDVVFHVAARVGAWGSYEAFYLPNVLGTWNVIHACRQLGVGRLVFTSSPSVVFDGTDMEGVDESVPYPDHYATHYPRTKAEAERLVLAADSADDGVRTLALRPHLVWGPGA